MASLFSLLASVHNFRRSSTRKRAFFTTPGLCFTQMESPVQLSIFPSLPLSSCERICQMFFERFNAARFSILERPMTQMYYSNTLNRLIDSGYDCAGVSVVYDGLLLTRARRVPPVAFRRVWRVWLGY